MKRKTDWKMAKCKKPECRMDHWKLIDTDTRELLAIVTGPDENEEWTLQVADNLRYFEDSAAAMQAAVTELEEDEKYDTEAEQIGQMRQKLFSPDFWTEVFTAMLAAQGISLDDLKRACTPFLVHMPGQGPVVPPDSSAVTGSGVVSAPIAESEMMCYFCGRGEHHLCHRYVHSMPFGCRCDNVYHSQCLGKCPTCGGRVAKGAGATIRHLNLSGLACIKENGIWLNIVDPIETK